ncbi:Fibrinogen-like protein A [Holothuria leucospilota]|uniref:Fibrinogen-like protein A n=1 Tax=Holothuria leucospilota TaxID=206669 RepID=A0A9Q1BZD5_HOLLE|nr:Fibrinogen-like protein A [Holothuria leucospilota]
MIYTDLLPIFSILFTSLLVKNVHSSAEDPSYFFYQQPVYPRDCHEVFQQCSVNTASGVYLIKPDGYDEGFEVYCDNQTNGGGWTVFHRRIDHNYVEFRRNFLEYNEGFGFLSSEFWLGNERLSFLTNQKRYQLRIDMTNSAGSSFYVTYDLFRISDEWGNYKITSVGQYDGTADTFIIQCPKNTIFGPCACQGTCADPDGCYKSCTVEETCTCPAGFLLSDSNCVPQEQCSCYDPTLGVIPQNNKSKFSLDCSEHCTCDKGTLTCDRNVQCDNNAVCEERNDVRKCYCNNSFTGDGLICYNMTTTGTPSFPTDCYDVFTSGSPDGVYTIQPTGWAGSPFEVYCNMSHGGGWTVLQRRVNGSVDFYRNWNSYKDGFGIPDHELWLGNAKLHEVTNQKNYTLRIDIINANGDLLLMNYDHFRVDSESTNYRLALGSFTGNTG